ncbi:unnamed protein product [Rotaria socialis]|uniref:RING-type domain-containing protein n=2 Tax=Rotaria socialis TaxID=392032 RepID=A0A820EIY8_9BILA|nr:unnamed protein product [Rotaria socialis]CAF3407405.1 unnamed protein product [Rotaria socialis]CAF3567142.1 unnamed protein product [Rotaria socialis]CAF4129827.1 unnamed protein product [Rotaria socialis]CAF4246821.1 unnamed protein product [Rotaria socialis]
MMFKYVNEDQIDIELKCTICDEPFEAPMNCATCGNTYCKSCILKWLEKQASCPSCRQTGAAFQPVISRVVRNQLNRLLVQCALCKYTGIQRSNFNDHISGTCPKYIIKCSNNCGWKGVRESHQQHLITCRQNPFPNSLSKFSNIVFILILSTLLYWIFRRGDK